MLNFGVRMNASIKKENYVELACSGTHANGVMALKLPNNLDITIYGFLSPFQVIFQKRVRVFHRGFQTREN